MFSQKSQEVHVVQEVVRVISDEEGIMMSNSPFYVDYFNRVSLWSFCTIVTGGKWLVQSWCGKSFLVPIWIASTGLLFNRSAQVLQEEDDWCSLDVGRVSWFQCGLLHEDFSSIVLRRYYKRRGFVQSLMRKRVSRIQCGFLHQDYFPFALHRCYKEEERFSREEGGCENPCVTRWFLI